MKARRPVRSGQIRSDQMLHSTPLHSTPLLSSPLRSPLHSSLALCCTHSILRSLCTLYCVPCVFSLLRSVFPSSALMSVCGVLLPGADAVYSAAVLYLRTPSLHPAAPQQLTARFVRHWLEQHYGLPEDALLPCKQTIIQATHDAVDMQRSVDRQSSAEQPSQPHSTSQPHTSSQPYLPHLQIRLAATQPATMTEPHSAKRVKSERSPQLDRSGEEAESERGDSGPQDGQHVQAEQSDRTSQPQPHHPLSAPLPSPLPRVAAASSSSVAADTAEAAWLAPSNSFLSIAVSAPPAPPAVTAVATASGGGELGGGESAVAGQVLDIGSRKLVTVSDFRGATLVHIREYYVDESGERQPGKKGIALTVQQWQQLMAGQTRVQAAIEQRQQRVDGAADDFSSDGGNSSFRRGRGGGGVMRGRRDWRGGGGSAAATNGRARWGARGGRAGNSA